MSSDTERLEHLSDRFNARDMDAVLATMHPGSQLRSNTKDTKDTKEAYFHCLRVLVSFVLIQRRYTEFKTAIARASQNSE
jgi:hypothetical protein